MTRIALTALLFALTALVAFALFYVVGATLGVVVFALLGLALVGFALYAAVRWRRTRRPSGRH